RWSWAAQMRDFGQRPASQSSLAGPAVETGPARFAARWTDAVLGTSYVPMSAAEIREFLTRLAARLAMALTASPFSLDPGRSVGRALVAAHFVSSGTLEKSLAVIGSEFLNEITKDPRWGPRAIDTDLTERIAMLQGAI